MRLFTILKIKIIVLRLLELLTANIILNQCTTKFSTNILSKRRCLTLCKALLKTCCQGSIQLFLPTVKLAQARLSQCLGLTGMIIWVTP